MWPFVYEDEAEIEDWFETTKEKLDHQLYKDAMAKKNIASAKARYDKEFRRLLKNYEKEHYGLMHRQERHKKIRKPIDKFKAWKKERHILRHKRWKLIKAWWKKWRFEREYKRLMKK